MFINNYIKYFIINYVLTKTPKKKTLKIYEVDKLKLKIK